MISRLGLLLSALSLLLLPVRAAAEPPPPNELGRVMILEYHKIDYPEERWTRTPENFHRDLEALYARGYRLVSLNDLLDGKIRLPAGTTPVVLTFDDSSPGQFRYVEKPGGVEIDPKCAVGVLEAFIRERPDFGRAATFYVLPGASKPNRLFNQPEYEAKKLQYLVAHGFEIGNHTLWHANLGKYDETTVRAQIAGAQQWIHRAVPDYRIRTLALPHGVYPRDLGWALRGQAKGETYRIDGILMVSGGAAPSPFARGFDPLRLPRIQAIDRDITSWLTHFDKHPGERFISDGDPTTITVPPAQRDRVRTQIPGGLKIVER
ncbi:MAG: polysaccharide deacetylase family protein [Candidatus Rokubacteria bacterium]|nr:polysaccharide deacetylase family protein [Candidatus Rokubacteria bacterium]